MGGGCGRLRTSRTKARGREEEQKAIEEAYKFLVFQDQIVVVIIVIIIVVDIFHEDLNEEDLSSVLGTKYVILYVVEFAFIM